MDNDNTWLTDLAQMIGVETSPISSQIDPLQMGTPDLSQHNMEMSSLHPDPMTLNLLGGEHHRVDHLSAFSHGPIILKSDGVVSSESDIHQTQLNSNLSEPYSLDHQYQDQSFNHPLDDRHYDFGGDTNGAFQLNSAPLVMNSDNCLHSNSYVYISSVGTIFRHNRDDSEAQVGYVNNQTFYGDYGHCVGYLTQNWKIYDGHDEYVGYVDSNCDVHRPDGTIVYHANTALGGAAWMLYIGMGGRP